MLLLLTMLYEMVLTEIQELNTGFELQSSSVFFLV